MKTTLNCAILCLVLFTAKAQSTISTLPSEFQKKLDEAKMSFTLPDSVTEVPVIKTEKISYDYAFKINGKNVEVRYAVRIISKEILKMFENRQKKEGDTVLNPNKLHRMLTPMMYSMLSGGKLTPKEIHIQYFKPERIKASAGADLGSMSTGTVIDWGQNYTHGFYVMMHKDDSADAYIFYLLKTRSK